jgi:hypothetical protein
LAALTCLAFLLTGAVPAEAAKHKKSWPSKKSGKSRHKKSPSPASSKSGAPAPADDGDDDSGEGESAQAGGGDEDEADAPAFKPKKVAKSSNDNDDEDEDSGSSSSSGDGDDDGSPVVRKKARKVAMEGDESAPIALELAAGPRVVNRSFQFNDALAQASEYKLPYGAAPFLDAAIYPLAFAGRGALANIGVIGRYERLVGTSTVSKDPNGGPSTTTTTTAQQFEVGARGRIPLDVHEVGVAVTYGSHVFLPASKDPGPSATSIPNVRYTFIGAGADTRLRFGIVTVGAHLGTRVVTETGPLNTTWFKKTTKPALALDAGLSLAVRVAPMFEVVGGVDFLRYGFAFNPKPADNLTFVAGGAVDQYISGFLALRVSITGG